MVAAFPDKARHGHTHHDQCAPLLVGDYCISEQCLGKGSMGKVQLGYNAHTGEKVAVKIVQRAVFLSTPSRKAIAREENKRARAIREAQLMRLMCHPHIVGFQEFILTDRYFYIVMDYIEGGQLLQYILKRKRLSEQRTRRLARQIGSALDYLHRHSIVHRDLKIENILVDKDAKHITLIDFGLSNLFCPETPLTTYCGSLYFAAPELLRASPYRGPEVDVWSFGVVLYVMVTGAVPFDDVSMPGLYRKIKAAEVIYPSHLSGGCRHLLERIFVVNPADRIILADILSDAWLLGSRPKIANHVPLRTPLTLPLDDTVIESMSHGLGLGTLDEIRLKLNVIVQSNVYRTAAEHVAKQCQLDRAAESLGQSAPAHDITPDSNYLFWGPYHDPQSVPAAYHPLLSMYYLIDEKRKRLYNEARPSVGRASSSIALPRDSDTGASTIKSSSSVPRLDGWTGMSTLDTITATSKRSSLPTPPNEPANDLIGKPRWSGRRWISSFTKSAHDKTYMNRSDMPCSSSTQSRSSSATQAAKRLLTASWLSNQHQQRHSQQRHSQQKHSQQTHLHQHPKQHRRGNRIARKLSALLTHPGIMFHGKASKACH